MTARTLVSHKLSHELDALNAFDNTKELPGGVSINLFKDTRKRIEAHADRRVRSHIAAFGGRSAIDLIGVAFDEIEERKQANIDRAAARRAAIEAAALEAVELALA